MQNEGNNVMKEKNPSNFKFSENMKWLWQGMRKNQRHSNTFTIMRQDPHQLKMEQNNFKQQENDKQLTEMVKKTKK